MELHQLSGLTSLSRLELSGCSLEHGLEPLAALSCLQVRPLSALTLQWQKKEQWHLVLTVAPERIAVQALRHLQICVLTPGEGELPAALSALSGISSLILASDYRAGGFLQLPLAWCTAAAVLSELELDRIRLPPSAPGVPLFSNLRYLHVGWPDQDLGAAALASCTSIQELSVEFSDISPHFWEVSAC